MKFSERYEYTSVRNSFQIDSIDESLRNGLWSLLKISCWDYVEISIGLKRGYYITKHENTELYFLCQRLWFSHFKKPLDELGNDWITVLKCLRNYFFNCKWHEVYDFLEFICNNYERPGFKSQFIEACNNLFEMEMSAYRFTGGVITPITGEQEIAEIENALNSEKDPIREHLQRSLELFSDKKNPDYRNSIKESILAVESLVKTILKRDSATLGGLITELKKKFEIHSALEKAFSHLYGYTNDEGGIRHALIDKDRTDLYDAKFMLVACSAFINYVEGKIQKSQ